jgi:hypothetical protein
MFWPLLVFMDCATLDIFLSLSRNPNRFCDHTPESEEGKMGGGVCWDKTIT